MPIPNALTVIENVVVSKSFFAHLSFFILYRMRLDFRHNDGTPTKNKILRFITSLTKYQKKKKRFAHISQSNSVDVNEQAFTSKHISVVSKYSHLKSIFIKQTFFKFIRKIAERCERYWRKQCSPSEPIKMKILRKFVLQKKIQCPNNHIQRILI